MPPSDDDIPGGRHCKHCGEVIYFDIQIEEWVHVDSGGIHCDIQPVAEPE